MAWIVGTIGIVICWITTTVQRYFVFKKEVEYREFAIEHGFIMNKDVDNVIDELNDMFEEEEAENE